MLPSGSLPWFADSHFASALSVGRTWEPLEPLVGMTDQPARPAVLPDGRAVLAWVDRFGEQPAIRAAVAPSLEGEFSAPVTVYSLLWASMAEENLAVRCGCVIRTRISYLESTESV